MVPDRVVALQRLLQVVLVQARQLLLAVGAVD